MAKNKDFMTRALVSCLPKSQAKLAPRLTRAFEHHRVNEQNIADAGVRLKETFGVDIHALINDLIKWFAQNADKVEHIEIPPLVEGGNYGSS